MQIIIYYLQGNILYSSRGNKFQSPYLEALLSESNPETIQCFYNLDYAVANLCKLVELTEDEIRKLWINESKGEETGKGRVYIEPYELNYYPKTMFTIDKYVGVKRYGNPFCILADMSQYMNTKIEPNLLDGQIFSRLNVAKDIAQQVYESLVKLNLKPKTLTSPIRAYHNDVLRNMNLPTWKDMPEECANYWYQACVGGWVEAFKIGHFEKLWDYDIQSAYPYQMRKLANFKNLGAGRWEKVSDFIPDHKDGMLGIFQAFYATESDFHPVIFKDFQGRNFTPTGEYPCFLTWNKMEFIKYHKLGEIKVVDGWVWKPNSPVSRPLYRPIEELYKKKNQATGIEREVIKRVMVGIYGKLGETLKYNASTPFGEFFNPCWRAEVENNTHLRVMHFCMQNKIVPVSITTDGVLTDKEINIIPSTKIGEWKLDSVTKGLVFGSGCIALQGKQKEGDFSLNYDELLERIIKDKEIKEITIEKEGFVTIGEAIERNIMDKLGEFEVDKRSIILNNDIKRIYPNEPENFGMLLCSQYDSIGIDISLVGGD